YKIISKSDTIVNRGDDFMKKFIARKPMKEVISIRIPTETLNRIDKKANSVEISRNELINQMIDYALSNMDETESKK
ncbi:MAG: ribbon-helix-helix protein, CopG family, partial [Ruminococcus sp.]|nr:ribbon-helix-helix protein, CopG family [Ruminococcus sp.]